MRPVALLLGGVAGLATSIALVFLGMRAVMAIGGACASGGPYIPVQPCPDGIPILMTLGMLGIFGFGAVAVAGGAMVGGAYGAIPLLAWPALFLSLGWNFLEFGLNPPGEEGLVWSWLFCAAVFFLMGGGPLLLGLEMARDTPVARIPASLGMPAARPIPLGVRVAERRAATAAGTKLAESVRADDAGAADDDLVGQLERLAALRRRGDITNIEFEAAKRRLLREEHD